MDNLDQFFSKDDSKGASTTSKVDSTQVNDKDDEQAAKTGQSSSPKPLLLDSPKLANDVPIIDTSGNTDMPPPPITISPPNTNSISNAPPVQVSPRTTVDDAPNFGKVDAVSPQPSKGTANRVDISPKGATSNNYRDVISPSKKSEITAEDQFLSGHFAHPTSIPSLLTKQVAFTGMKLSGNKDSTYSYFQCSFLTTLDAFIA